MDAAHPDGPRQQALPVSTGTLGMWLFLSTEAMFFAAVFSVWFVLRASAGGDWPARETMHVGFAVGVLNTLVLLASGITAWLAVEAAKRESRAAARGWIVVTVLLGGLFLGIKAGELEEKLRRGLVAVDGTRSLRDRADAVYVSSLQETIQARLLPESGLNRTDREELQLVHQGLVGWTASRAGQAATVEEQERYFRNLAAVVYPVADPAGEHGFLRQDSLEAARRERDLIRERENRTRELAEIQARIGGGAVDPAGDPAAGQKPVLQSSEGGGDADRAAVLTLELSSINSELVQIASRLTAVRQFGPCLLGSGLNGEYGMRLPVAIPGSRMWSATWLLMTGMHALHMLAGMAAWGVILFSGGSWFCAAVGNAARYWHFVDAVWLVIFVIVYCL